ncbi:AAA family ATPase [Mumia sp. DW29H23]|uniref:AAA family ATPase n=1 Tax=Mumia sp. DW29H23 TaxID=3421241 RepID=UPI003D69BD6F
MTDVPDFVATFTRFLRDVVDLQENRADSSPLTALVDRHLGCASTDIAIVTERLSRIRLADADVALSALAHDGQLVGLASRHAAHGTFAEVLRGELGSTGVGPVPYVTLPVGPGKDRQVVSHGVWLFEHDGVPLAVRQRDANPMYGLSSAQLEIASPTPEATSHFLASLRAVMAEHSVLRGQVVSFTGQRYDDETLDGLFFHERPDVPADEVVLPPGTLERIERHVIAIGANHAAMRAAGQHLKRGVLLYGPPGTGKTHTVRHLVGKSEGTTAILLSGNALGLVREATQIARSLEPAIVVLEDCDLVAEDRDMIDSPDSMLFELLDALDGLDGDADVAFVMTTNRPDLLERALARRPGRVDLAVEIPLPDADARAALFTLYARDQAFSSDALHAAADRADGVTASFAKELVRRAVLRAVLAERAAGDDDLAAALDELMSDQELFTRSLLASGENAFAAPTEDWEDVFDDSDDPD